MKVTCKMQNDGNKTIKELTFDTFINRFVVQIVLVF